MQATRYGGWLASVLTAALLLAGCSGPASVAERVVPGRPPALTEAGGSALSPLEGPTAVWLEDGRRFALITLGRSSCPAVVTSMEAVGSGSIGLRVEPSGGSGPCTADLAPTTHELALPDSVTGRPVTLTLTYPENDATSTLTLDRAGSPLLAR